MLTAREQASALGKGHERQIGDGGQRGAVGQLQMHDVVGGVLHRVPPHDRRAVAG